MRKREIEAVLQAPIVRRRTILEKERGRLRAFCVQLEFNHCPTTGEADDWKYIARFDHNPASLEGHDITEEGLHMDLRHPVEGDRTSYGFPPVPLSRAPAYAEDHFDEKYLEICERYLSWCDEVKDSWRAILPLSP